jgi:carboxyl-terminal processing protease
MNDGNELKAAGGRRRSAVPFATIGLLLLLPLLPGGGAPGAGEAHKSQLQRETEALNMMGRVFEYIYKNYVDEVDPQKIAEAGVRGMLAELDEHSQYLPPESYSDLMTATEGEFGGLGISIVIRDHYPTVVSPIEGTPAFFMGIQGGDQIVEIEGKATFDWKSEDAVKLLRGEPGTKVTIKIRREGTPEPIPYTITRDIIKVESVPYAFMIGDVGYIRIQNFARTTADELRRKLDELEAQGAKGVVLDLRWNPGGLLTAAKEVGEIFLDRGKLLVFTKGRLSQQNASYYSEPAGKVHNKLPMIVMVNGSSASASEIVAAALQDHDAALIVGKTSFGKGSVQTVYRLDETSALKLTTAKYYTPSGRSIHKDRHKDDSDLDLTAGDSTAAAAAPAPGLQPASPEVPRHEKQQYKTDMGRTVYGGGGITPDVEMDQAPLTDYELALERDGALFSFATHYATDRKPTADLKVDEPLLAEFRAFLAKREKFPTYLKEYKLRAAAQDSLFAANRAYVERGIRREIMRRGFGAQAAYKVAIEDDTQLHEALALFRKAGSLQALLKYAAEWNEQQMRAAKAAPKAVPAAAK